MSTEPKSLNGKPEPFRRPVIWGRPPATVFRAGPLPKGGTLPPLPEPPQQPARANILTGSMIPRAAPKPVPEATPKPTPVPTPAPGVTESTADRARKPDLTVRPLPPVPAEAEAAPVAAPVPTPLPVPDRPAAAATMPEATLTPERAPTPRVSPVPPRPASRTPLYAGLAVAAVGLLALGGWLLTRSSAETALPEATAPVAPPVVAAPSVSEGPPAPVAVTQTETIRAARRAEPPAPASPAPAVRAPAPRPSADGRDVVRPPATPVVRPTVPPVEVIAPPPAATAAPLIVITPAPAVTEAERPQLNPDAPIATRPQPLEPAPGPGR